jgi:tetratricopeptide (TPR) repeat protein
MKKNIKIIIILLITSFFNFNLVYAAGSGAGSSGDGGNDKAGLYKKGKKLVIRAKQQEKKNRAEKAQELYLKAYKIFEKAYEKNKQNPDILNYLGFTLRKTGNLKKAEMYYLKGLEFDASHLGINEYLGELYVQTNRIDLAKKRLTILQGCNCEEYKELKELIENN